MLETEQGDTSDQLISQSPSEKYTLAQANWDRLEMKLNEVKNRQ
jgi:hypothetical protein